MVIGLVRVRPGREPTWSGIARSNCHDASHDSGGRSPRLGPASQMGVEPWSDGGQFPSFFPPPDAGPLRIGRRGWGRRGTAEAVARPFAHVTTNNQDQMGIGRDPRGERGAALKIAGIAYTGSNPVPATLPWSCGNAAAKPIKRPPG